MAREQAVQAIESVIKRMMDRVLERVLITDPFLVDKHKADKPLYAALVPDEIFKGAHFERRFVTPFGGVWEKLAVAVAEKVIGFGKAGYAITGTIPEERLKRIQEVLNKLEHGNTDSVRIRPDWEKELQYILEANGEPIPTTVISDVYVENSANNKKFGFELKAPLPNSDQTKVSKEKMFKLLAMEPPQVDGAFFVLPYNPYGKRENYAWSFPMRWFDMKKDPVVLIGDDFWDMIGGAGTYQMFIEEINKLGKEYRERIYREYLGIEPPSDEINKEVL